jgi:Ca-activated chloride channel family protein
MMGFRLQDPIWALLLVPLFVLVVIAVRRQRSAAVLYSSVHVLKTLPRTLALRAKRILPWVRFLGMALVILALARPQHGREEFRVRTEGIAIQMAIDRSGSMEAMDFEFEGERVNRLAVVKEVFHDFVAGKEGLPGRPDDLIGLVAFGGYADSKCPLTLDHGALLQVLETVEIAQPILDSRGRILNERLLQEERATAIGDAIALSVGRLREVKAKSKVLILLSDGENTAGIIDPQEAAEAARTLGVKIYTIGVGSTGRVPVLARDLFGKKAYQYVNVRLDEATLKKLAETTGGRYFNAKDTEALREVYGEIDRLEKTETEGRLYTEYRELFQYALFPGLGLVLLELLMICTRFRSLP